MKMLRNWKNLVWMSCLAFTSMAAAGQELRLGSGPDVTCQELDPNDLASATPAIINFDAGSQAYIVCVLQASLPSLQIVTTGSVPRFSSDASLGLDDFQRLEFEQDFQDLFVNSPFGEHRVADFSDELLPLSAASADALLGPVKSRYVTKQVCKTEYQTKKVCSIQPKEVCKVVYGRTECYIQNVEVCKDVSTPVQVCKDVPTLEYYRELAGLSGLWKEKPVAYCPKGVIEKRSRVVYGRTIYEQRCCETKVVYGQTQKTCSPWVSL
jgi:hypothetical protein